MINRFQRDKSTLRREYLYRGGDGGGGGGGLSALLEFSRLYRARVEWSYVRRERRRWRKGIEGTREEEAEDLTIWWGERWWCSAVALWGCCKIKALRAKTNTYIKTPVRGEEPVFVVTGRKEDVGRAKREILSAAEHFSQIRASRKNSLGNLLGAPPGPPATAPGHVTIQVRVPYRVVGLVVGPKGATIKRIQHQTHTYIVTPSRDKEPIFEVTGLPESVDAAKREIQAHITLRTGTAPGVVDEGDLLGALCRGGLGSILGISNSMDQPGSNSSNGGSNGAFSSSASCSSSSSTSGGAGLGDIVAIWGPGIDRDEGLGESPSFESQPTSASIWSFPSVPLPSRPSPPATASPASPTDSLLGGVRRDCVVCGDKEVTAALVPCGHNHFCMDCGNRVCESSDPSCPICSRPVLQVLRIFT
ncbi:RNA-binding protein MEX3A [Ooceraea biroi]|uniref:RNA-binding protein MEX3A n=1 Tax=Ooceraea biroi TaxID=2015173 RepID=A0A026WYW5_OOCBI|nr:RNA-binding protein MEX3A [Ooceraea biroi]